MLTVRSLHDPKQYVHLCDLLIDRLSIKTISLHDPEWENPRLVIDDVGNVIINNQIKIQPDHFDQNYYKLLNYVYNYENNQNSNVCLVVSVTNRNLNSDMYLITIQLHVGKNQLLQFNQGGVLPPIYWISNILENFFVEFKGHTPGTFSKNKICVAKILPLNTFETQYQQYIKLSLYPHQHNNILWMSNLEYNITNSEQSYVFLNMSNFLQYRSMIGNQLNDDDLQSLYLNKHTNKLYDCNHLFDQYNPVYSLKINGGVLCDDVGIGKTASIIGLIIKQKMTPSNSQTETHILEKISPKPSHIKKKFTKPKIQLKPQANTNLTTSDQKLNKGQLPEISDYFKNINKYHQYHTYAKSKATLIICPRRLFFQWCDELDKFSAIDLCLIFDQKL